MLKRRTHSKSRRGCQSCKKRHIKCDEKQPQCINCVVRGIACIYQLPLALNSHFKPTKSRRDSVHRKTQSHDPEDSSTKESLSVTSLSPSLTAFSTTVESNRLLELELMHQWSTKTWRGLYSVPEDQESLQQHLPRAALRDSYLLNVILAIAAADLACQSGCDDGRSVSLYNRAAYQYWQKAIDDFRLQLEGKISEENVPLLYHFAVIEAICRFSLTRSSTTTFNRLNAIFDMIVGTYTFLAAKLPYLPNCFRQVMEEFDPSTMDAISSKTQVMLDKLTSISCLVYVTLTGEEAGTTTALACDVQTYRIAIAHIKHCFAEDAAGNIRGSCFSIVTAVSPDFFQALKRLEPMALFITLFYGVLWQRLSKDATMWWLDSSGTSIVEEISEILSDSLISSIPDALAVISWTRREVGLNTPE